MMMRVTLYFSSLVSITDRPVFDAIMYYCYMAKRVAKGDYLTPTGRELKSIIEKVRLPLSQQEGFYLCSYAFFGEMVEGLDSWKKHWESRYDRHADFGRGKRRVNTGSGEYRSWSVPFSATSVDKMWFYFDTSSPQEVRELIENYLVGVGKKVNIGLGWIDRIEWEVINAKADGSGYRCYCRPLPKSFGIENIEAIFPSFPTLKLTRGSYRPPYWFPPFQEEIIIPEIHNDTGM